MRREKFLQAARGYLGTPFHHQGRVPGVGLDCIGVVICACGAAGLVVPNVSDYSVIPSNGLFMQKLLPYVDKIELEDVTPGDLVMFAFKSEPQHIAIVSSLNPIVILHSYMQVGKVVENNLDGIWLSRLTGCYRIRGIE